MKRRKTVNRYTIGENGQITNNSPRPLSNRTQKLIDFMMFAEMLSEFSGESNEQQQTETDDNIDDTKSEEA